MVSSLKGRGEERHGEGGEEGFPSGKKKRGKGDLPRG